MSNTDLLQEKSATVRTEAHRRLNRKHREKCAAQLVRSLNNLTFLHYLKSSNKIRLALRFTEKVLLHTGYSECHLAPVYF